MTGLARSLWPWSPTWRRAVYAAGHCVMARLLDLKVTRMDFDPVAGGVVEWAHASAAYPKLRVAPVPRNVAETDALVALAGGVALWLYAAPEVTADDIRAGDVLAEEFLLDVFDQWFVVPDWREYLRSRALSMLNPNEQKAVIAWLAVRLVERGSVRAGAVYDLLDDARQLVQPYLAFHRHIDDYIALFGPPPFPQPLDALQLPADVVDALHARDVVSLGQLLSQTPADLAFVPGLDDAGVSAIRSALAARGLELAEDAAAELRPLAGSFLGASRPAEHELVQAGLQRLGDRGQRFGLGHDLAFLIARHLRRLRFDAFGELPLVQAAAAPQLLQAPAQLEREL